jgi:hypothetical protein
MIWIKSAISMVTDRYPLRDLFYGIGFHVPRNRDLKKYSWCVPLFLCRVPGEIGVDLRLGQAAVI